MCRLFVEAGSLNLEVLHDPPDSFEEPLDDEPEYAKRFLGYQPSHRKYLVQFALCFDFCRFFHCVFLRCALFDFTSQGSGMSSFRVVLPLGGLTRFEGMKKPLAVSRKRL